MLVMEKPASNPISVDVAAGSTNPPDEASDHPKEGNELVEGLPNTASDEQIAVVSKPSQGPPISTIHQPASDMVHEVLENKDQREKPGDSDNKVLSIFNEEIFRISLANLKETRESVLNMADWCILNIRYAYKIARSWVRVLKKAKVDQQLTLT